ncbi:hydroxyethylthiazole kinase-like sugar kinase family protein [Bradyrhizobium sp. USDA 372]
MLSLVAVVAAFMAAERVQVAFMAEVSAVALFTRAASMAGIASPEVRALLIR